MHKRKQPQHNVKDILCPDYGVVHVLNVVCRSAGDSCLSGHWVANTSGSVCGGEGSGVLSGGPCSAAEDGGGQSQEDNADHQQQTLHASSSHASLTYKLTNCYWGSLNQRGIRDTRLRRQPQRRPLDRLTANRAQSSCTLSGVTTGVSLPTTEYFPVKTCMANLLDVK